MCGDTVPLPRKGIKSEHPLDTQLTPHYSPLPISEYLLTRLPACEVSSIMNLPDQESLAVWNLFWLSVPALDVLPDHGGKSDWYKHYMPVPGAIRTITADAIADEAMFRKLLMHPTRFINFFEREDHSIYSSYDALGGETWVHTVLARAAVAEARMRGALPPLGGSGFGNVIALFGKRLA